MLKYVKMFRNSRQTAWKRRRKLGNGSVSRGEPLQYCAAGWIRKRAKYPIQRCWMKVNHMVKYNTPPTGCQVIITHGIFGILIRNCRETVTTKSCESCPSCLGIDSLTKRQANAIL